MEYDDCGSRELLGWTGGAVDRDFSVEKEARVGHSGYSDPWETEVDFHVNER